jgi:hypothetical protein
VCEFISTGKILRFPTAILASSLVLLSVLVLTISLILQTVECHHRLSFEHTLLNWERPAKNKNAE